MFIFSVVYIVVSRLVIKRWVKKISVHFTAEHVERKLQRLKFTAIISTLLTVGTGVVYIFKTQD